MWIMHFILIHRKLFIGNISIIGTRGLSLAGKASLIKQQWGPPHLGTFTKNVHTNSRELHTHNLRPNLNPQKDLMPFLKLRSGDIHVFFFHNVQIKKAAKSTSAHEGNSTIHRVSVDWKDCLRFLGRPRMGISSVNGHISVCRGGRHYVSWTMKWHTHGHLPRGMNNEVTHMNILWTCFFVLFPEGELFFSSSRGWQCQWKKRLRWFMKVLFAEDTEMLQRILK